MPFQHFLHSHVEFPFFSRKQKQIVLAISDCSEAPTSTVLVLCLTLNLCNSRSMRLMFLDTWQDQAIMTATFKIKMILSSPLNIIVMLLAGYVVPALLCYAPQILHWDIMFFGPLRSEVFISPLTISYSSMMLIQPDSNLLCRELQESLTRSAA